MKRKTPTPKRKAPKSKKKVTPDSSCSLQVRLSRGQRKVFREVAKANGLDLSGWVRSTLLRAAAAAVGVRQPEPEEIPANGVESAVQIPVEEMG